MILNRVGCLSASDNPSLARFPVRSLAIFETHPLLFVQNGLFVERKSTFVTFFTPKMG